MDKIKQRAITYSLLAHIRSKGYLTGGPIEIFIPLIKRVLSKLNEHGIFSGESIMEIKNKADEFYAVDFPIPVLRMILTKIAVEVNTDTEVKFLLHQDDSFEITNYAFTEFEETIRIHKLEIESLEKLFGDFCITLGKDKVQESSLLEFIEKNKFSLSKYLSHKEPEKTKDFAVEAQFVDYFKQIPPIYDTIRKIYLGSIISSYIEYKTENVKTEIELVFDTNFILGFLDLNTKESTHTCRKIIEITKNQGYKLTVLQDTINETISLLKAKAENFALTFLQKGVYPEDIYNACERRSLNKADLERIADNLENEIKSYGISIIYDTSKYKNLAKFSKEYEILKKYRHNSAAALHDATAIYFVRERRKKYIKDFENVNCWFINNTINRNKYSELKGSTNTTEYQPETIKADDFLNIIWLSNPAIEKNIHTEEVTDIGLSSLVSIGLTDSLPKLSIIRELDDNIHKYAQDDGLTDLDVVRIATRITTRQLTDIDKLNQLAKENKEKFVKRLNEESKKQKEIEEARIKRIEELINEFAKKSEGVNRIKSDYETKSKVLDEKIQIVTEGAGVKDKKILELSDELEREKKLRKKDESRRLAEKREIYIDQQVLSWKRKTNYELGIWLLLLLVAGFGLFWFSDWNLDTVIYNYTHNLFISISISVLYFIFSTITLKKWYDKNHNHSNIENFKKTIKIPNDLQDEE